MKLGIIGLNGSGRSTVFDALTQQFSDSGNRSETRIGTIAVPDTRVDRLSDMYQPRKTIFAQVEYLLPGQAGGKRDKDLWDGIRDCDALIHVARNFGQPGLDPPNPFGDFLTLNQEMIFSDLVVTENRLERLGKDKQRGKKTSSEEAALLADCLKTLESETPLRSNPDLMTAKSLRGYAFISAKPQLVLVNNDDEDEKLPASKGSLFADTMVMRGKLEQELAQMTEEEAGAFLEEFNIAESAMDRVLQKSYELLGLISFFTVGEDEVRAWTIPADTLAVNAAEVIHSDIKKGFIRAEVLAYDDLMAAGTFQDAKKTGTVRLEGKEYPVKNGDIINFRFNV